MIAAWSPAATPSRVWPSMISGGAGGDRDVGEEPRSEARADRRAADRGDDGLRAVDHVVDEVARLLPHAQTRLVAAAHLFDEIEIAPARERVTPAGKEDRRDLRISVNLAPHVRELVVHARIGRVGAASTLHGDAQHAWRGHIQLQALKGLVSGGHARLP